MGEIFYKNIFYIIVHVIPGYYFTDDSNVK
jgi:hypothetical protein